MGLEFIGRGSSFNVSEGNNNAFYKNNASQMLLIDCGETTFAKILEKNLLNGVTELYVAITHTHSDHFGSFGSLALHMFFKRKQKINLILTNNKKQNKILKLLIKGVGVDSSWINYITSDDFVSKMSEFKKFKFIETPHDKTLKTFSIVYETEKGLVYYSSDTNSTKLLEKYLSYNNLYRAYIDTCLAEHKKSTHVGFNQLLKSVPKPLRHKVYGMHLDDIKLVSLLKDNGFNVVEKI